MALITCKECQREISEHAPQCPHCGLPMSSPGPSVVKPIKPVKPPVLLRPVYLYDEKAVMAAAFIAGPLGGSIIMAMNYRSLGENLKAFASVACAILLCVGAAQIKSIPSTLQNMMPIIFALLFYTAAQKLQGPAIAAHVQAGGKKGSIWVVLAISLPILAAFFVLIPMLYQSPASHPSIP